MGDGTCVHVAHAQIETCAEAVMSTPQQPYLAREEGRLADWQCLALSEY